MPFKETKETESDARVAELLESYQDINLNRNTHLFTYLLFLKFHKDKQE